MEEEVGPHGSENYHEAIDHLVQLVRASRRRKVVLLLLLLGDYQ